MNTRSTSDLDSTSESITPFLSIIIPTRERSKYVISAIESFVEIKSPNIELIISDNASTDGTCEKISEFSDRRIRYINTKKRISMRENFEFAMSAARGEYIIIIGDDDAVIPSSITKLIDLLKHEKPDLVRWFQPYYFWPLTSIEKKSSLFVYKNIIFGGYENLSTDELVRLLYDGSLDTHHLMPAIYHGCVSRRLMDRIRGYGGCYFGSGIPDCYVAFIGCILSSEYIQIDYPVTIIGTSPASNSSRDKSVFAAFVSELKTDPVVEPLDTSSGVISILYLSTLIAANRNLPEPRTINWLRWAERALVEIQQQYKEPQIQKAQIDQLRSDIEQHGGTFPASIPPIPAPRRQTKRAKLWRKLGLYRIRVKFDDHSTSIDAVRSMEYLLLGCTIKHRNIWTKVFQNLNWAEALIKFKIRRRL